tara:strand:- start:160 stop:300 length:141 start_codon:yes stop_codon:yes gene_type:complete
MHEIISCQRLEENAELAEYETDYGVHSTQYRFPPFAGKIRRGTIRQ